ncbi:hypothetical protein HYQ46_013093 [Verticillium longisporum]|nr:hypothetical protein HYQ46_013093 [Verticillium longisporum]
MFGSFRIAVGGRLEPLELFLENLLLVLELASHLALCVSESREFLVGVGQLSRHIFNTLFKFLDLRVLGLEHGQAPGRA